MESTDVTMNVLACRMVSLDTHVTGIKAKRTVTESASQRTARMLMFPVEATPQVAFANSNALIAA